MELDYIEMTKLVDIRIMQIQDSSKEHEYFNKEYRELTSMRKALTELILLERHTPTNYVDLCNAGKIKGYEHNLEVAVEPAIDETK